MVSRKIRRGRATPKEESAPSKKGGTRTKKKERRTKTTKETNKKKKRVEEQDLYYHRNHSPTKKKVLRKSKAAAPPSGYEYFGDSIVPRTSSSTKRRKGRSNSMSNVLTSTVSRDEYGKQQRRGRRRQQDDRPSHGSFGDLHVDMMSRSLHSTGSTSQDQGPIQKKRGKRTRLRPAIGRTRNSDPQFYSDLAEQAQSRGLTWASASSPAYTLEQAMESISVLRDLQAGIPVLKVSSNKGDLQKRFLTLSHDKCTLFLTHSRIVTNSKGKKTETNHQTTATAASKVPLWTPSKGWNAKTYQRSIDVADILEVQGGVVGTKVMEELWATPSKRKKVTKSSLVTIHHHVVGSHRAMVHLIVEHPSHRMGLIGALETIRQTYDDQAHWIGREILLLRYMWFQHSNSSTSTRIHHEKEFGALLQRLQFDVPDVSKRYRAYIKENLIKKNKELTYRQLTDLLESLKPRSMGDEIWQKLFGDKKSVSAKVFHETFLAKSQGETSTTLQDARDFIAAVNSIELMEGSEPTNALKLSKVRFVELLRSTLNDAYDPSMQAAPTKKKNKLTKPLSHYWINTSHNTYLTGDQITSDSSVEAYTTALQRGCKCLEIDCWDGDARKSGELVPVVYHGHTMTSKIELRSVLLVIEHYMRAHPHTYPVILSLENHCSPPYQQEVAQMIQLIFQSRLFLPKTEHRKFGMPSPEELKGKVVIQAKLPVVEDEGSSKKTTKKKMDSDPTSTLFNQLDIDSSSKRKKRNKQRKKNGTSSTSSNDSSNKKRGGGGTVKELEKLTYFQGTKFQLFEDSIGSIPSQMHSISETRIVKIVTQYDNHPDLWREYNTGHLTRTYPAGTRVDSSNFNPILSWAMGCQMVALNFQSHDINMVINDGMFRQMGNCGYVEKPDSVMGGSKPLPKKMKIRILAGSCLPGGEEGDRTIEPIVKVELHDVQMTKRGKEQHCQTNHETKSNSNNGGYAPVWSEKSHEFIVQNEDVAMFVFRIIDAGTKVVATSAIPARAMRKGFRSVQLFDELSTRLGPYQFASLLIHVMYAGS